jgi:hypothetical protein
MIDKIKLALPDLNLTINFEWLLGFLNKFNPLQLLGFLPSLISIPGSVWPKLLTIPIPQWPNLPEATFDVDLSILQPTINTLLSVFEGALKELGLFIRWLAGLGSILGSLLGALLNSLNLHISFPFPGIDFGQAPPAGTPWPGPFPAQTSVVPLITWPEWMKPPFIANIPASLPPGTSMAAFTSGTFAGTSMPGYLYHADFVLRVKSGLTPDIYSQQFFLEGTYSPAGAPLSRMAQITLTAQVLEPTLSPGIRPVGLLSYP